MGKRVNTYPVFFRVSEEELEKVEKVRGLFGCTHKEMYLVGLEAYVKNGNNLDKKKVR